MPSQTLSFSATGISRVALLHLLLLLLPLLSCAGHSPAQPNSVTSAPDDLVTTKAYSGTLPVPLVVSVLNFEDRIQLPGFTWVRKGLADMLITDLSQAVGVEMVQRERLEDVMREQSLQAAGRVEEKTAVRLGRLTGATVMVVGGATRVGDLLRLDAQLLDVERGIVLGAASVVGPLEDVLTLEKQLASRLVVLLQRDGGAPGVFPSSASPARSAVKALYDGVDADDRGDIDGALGKFETAMKDPPSHAEAHRRYERTLRKVDSERLWSNATGLNGSEEDQRRLGARFADDLFREGLMAEIQPEGLDKGNRVNVVIRFNNDTVERLRREIERSGGTTIERAGNLVLRLAENAVHFGFIRAIETRRRVFLHVQGPDERQGAVYSQLRGWAMQDWVSRVKTDEVLLHVGKRLIQAISLPAFWDLGSLRFGVSLEPIPREQAILQVELIRAAHDGRETVLGPGLERQIGETGTQVDPSALEVDELRMGLQREFERRWNPDVWERSPGPGYLPSARRSVMVSAQIGERKLVSPRIIGGSGDRSFDEACLGAVKGLEGRMPEVLFTALDRLDGGARMRISCNLLKDVPSLLNGR